MSLLVTTGSTVTFKEIVKFVVQDDVVEFYASVGVSKVFVQYGNEVSGTTHVSQQILNQALKSNTQHVLFEFFAYSPNLQQYIQNADVILSHGGTGTLIDILQFHKRLIVVYNESLMDNHQAQIAGEFEKLGYCKAIGSNGLDLEAFSRIFRSLQESEPSRYQQTSSGVLKSIVYSEISKAKCI